MEEDGRECRSEQCENRVAGDAERSSVRRGRRDAEVSSVVLEEGGRGCRCKQC